jgi:Restriction endonuclease
MSIITRTINPLPFGNLEPRRFEDLVRQLAYEFRNWRRLEATGRSGGDEGFDARGYEIVDRKVLDADCEFEDDEDKDETATDRLWLIQCKRERSIGPKQLQIYLGQIVLTAEHQLHGIVFSAACDFSKKSRDILAAWCRENFVSEWYVWGRGELEDMLFQPRFDHLLFVYFGISLKIRFRSLATGLRHQVAIKRKLKRFLDIESDGLVLIRDIEDKLYPRMPSKDTRPHFRVRLAHSISPYGFVVKVSRRNAWLSANGEHWDVALSVYDHYGAHADPWNQPTDEDEIINKRARDFWLLLPESERAWLYFEGVIPYENIVLIDDVGDDEFPGPHVFVTGWNAGYKLSRAYIKTIEHSSPRSKDVDSADKGRVVKFPNDTRQPRRKWLGY